MALEYVFFSQCVPNVVETPMSPQQPPHFKALVILGFLVLKMLISLFCMAILELHQPLAVTMAILGLYDIY
jgi:hypothetical protein